MNTLTAIGFWVGIALILVYEFYALKQHQGKTISEIVWHLCTERPLVPLAFGVLIGHFFWQAASVYQGLCK